GEPLARPRGRRHHHLAAGALEHLRRLHGRHPRRGDAGLPALRPVQPRQPRAGRHPGLHGLQDPQDRADRRHGPARRSLSPSTRTSGTAHVQEPVDHQARLTLAAPAIMLTFVLAGLACTFAGLCYAEFASMIPVSGSAYSYTYATLGEAVAWFVGWSLVLEYLFAASAVSVGWSAYTISLMEN